MKVQITYNPYIVKTNILLDGKNIDDKNSPLIYIKDKRLQEWIEPNNSWEGIFPALRKNLGDSSINIEFIGTIGDFRDLEDAKKRYGDCFEQIDLVHKNAGSAKNIDPYQRMIELRKLYEKLQNGPIEEFKTEDIKKNFEAAINSEFKIVIVAPMSSGKSTLINSIIGHNLLPAINQATTAVITEIKDNDELDNFIVSAYDKHGNMVVENEKATLKLITELNNKKDPDDVEQKESLIKKIKIEGPIPNIPSDVLNTVFVDTPGGNNSQNIEHQELMDEAINDENKSLILYVLNGTQLTTNDSNAILNKISHAMQNKSLGKQSQDRFLFVATRMDGIDVEHESFEQVIEDSILPLLEKNGISNPRLFLTSSEVTRLIRMTQNNEKMSEFEEDNLETFLKRFNRKSRMLTNYSSIDKSTKDELNDEALKYMNLSKKCDSKKESLEYAKQAAVINSGIPALEYAIKEYLEKYALAIKIKTVHDTFMFKVQERNMINIFKQQCVESEKQFEKIKKEREEKTERYVAIKNALDCETKIKNIHVDRNLFQTAKSKVQKEIKEITDNVKGKIPRDKAEQEVEAFKIKVTNTMRDIDKMLNEELIKKTEQYCNQILNEYSSYLKQIDSEGVFNIGSFDMTETVFLKEFNSKRIDQILIKEKYTKIEEVKIGTEIVKRKGFFAMIARFFGMGGYESKEKYETRYYTDFKKIAKEELTDIETEIYKNIENIRKIIDEKINSLKKESLAQLNELDTEFNKLMTEIDTILKDYDQLKNKVDEDREKSKWVSEFIESVEGLLKI